MYTHVLYMHVHILYNNICMPIYVFIIKSARTIIVMIIIIIRYIHIALSL